MKMYDIISKKRDKGELSREEIGFFVQGYNEEKIKDYEAAALIMAVYINGMTKQETVDLTEEMTNSGKKIDLSQFGGVTVDKHSTGGVGDKTTLVIVPIAAALGAKVLKMSGRGLGHTGGTVDKLESIPGFRTELTDEEIMENLNSIGAVMIGQSEELAPADKKIYSLRDVTATVSSMPLIASSIMSKKIASGNKCIVLDVKYGSGAFMKTRQEAKELADIMIDIGEAAGRKVSAVISDMNVPLGNSVGNSLEVIEAVKILKGEQKDDLYEVCVELAANMYRLTSGKSLEECTEAVKDVISSGKAFEKLKEIVAAQGGDISVLENTELFKKASVRYEVKAKQSGAINCVDCEKIGLASVRLGAGRSEIGGAIDHSAGIVLYKKPGDFVNEGDVLAVFFTNDREKLAEAEDVFRKAFL